MAIITLILSLLIFTFFSSPAHSQASRAWGYLDDIPLNTTVFSGPINVFRKPNGDVVRGRGSSNDTIYNERASNDPYHHHSPSSNDATFHVGDNIITSPSATGLAQLAIDGGSIASAAGFSTAGVFSAAALAALSGAAIGAYLEGGFESSDYEPIAFNLGSPFHEIINPSQIPQFSPVIRGDPLPQTESADWVPKWEAAGSPEGPVDTPSYLPGSDAVPTGRPDFDGDGLPDSPTQPGLAPKRNNQNQAQKPDGLPSEPEYDYCGLVSGGIPLCAASPDSVCRHVFTSTLPPPTYSLSSVSDLGSGACRVNYRFRDYNGDMLPSSTQISYSKTPTGNYTCADYPGTSLGSNPFLCQPAYEPNKYYPDQPTPQHERGPSGGFSPHPQTHGNPSSPDLPSIPNFQLATSDGFPVPSAPGATAPTMTSSVDSSIGTTHDLTLHDNGDGTLDFRHQIEGVSLQRGSDTYPIPMRIDTLIGPNMLPVHQEFTIDLPHGITHIDPLVDKFTGPDGDIIYDPLAPPIASGERSQTTTIVPTTNPDGSETVTVTTPDGTRIETTTFPDGSSIQEVTYPFPSPTPSFNPNPNQNPIPGQHPIPGSNPIPIQNPNPYLRPGDYPDFWVNPFPNLNPRPHPHRNPRDEPNPNPNPVTNPDNPNYPNPNPNPAPLPYPNPNPNPDPADPTPKPPISDEFEWECGILGKPDCRIIGDPAELEDWQQWDNDFDMTDLYKIPLFDSLPSAIPQREVDCPVAQLDFRGVMPNGFFDDVYTMDLQCQIIEPNYSLIRSLFLAFWLILAIRIVLTA